jgi:hypothetical protein
MLAVGLNLIIGDSEMNDKKAEALYRKAYYGQEDKIGLDPDHPLYTGHPY